jgi:hypothetical protein
MGLKGEREKDSLDKLGKKIGRSKAQGGMGFQDLTCFSKALLAKQCWRLAQNPHSLKTHVEANVGSRPSLAWRSINSAKGLLFEGLVWRIGDCRTASIWGDHWLPRPSTYGIQSLVSILAADAKLNELVDQNGLGWNVPLIR